MHSAYPLVPECPEELYEGHAEAAGLQRNTEGMICAQVPVLAAQPSGLTVLPIQPTASLLTQPSAQLQERPEDVRVPCVAWLVSWSGCMPHGNLCSDPPFLVFDDTAYREQHPLAGAGLRERTAPCMWPCLQV